MPRTNFPTRARREDPEGHMVVQYMLEVLRDVYDEFLDQFLTGTATITSGNTSVTVTHSMGKVNQVVASPTSDPGGRWWVSNVTGIDFDLNLSVAAGIGGVTFDWLARGA